MIYSTDVPLEKILCAWGTLGRDKGEYQRNIAKGQEAQPLQPAHSRAGDETPCGDFYQLSERTCQSHPQETEALI